jgi:outer membrane protein assembly factor BamB
MGDYIRLRRGEAFMTFGRLMAVAFIGWASVGESAMSGEPGAFEELAVPVRKAGLMGTLVGPGPVEGSQRIYFNFRQEGGKLFLVAVDPDTGKSEQFKSPAGTGAWGFVVGPDDRIYLGTHEGPDPQDSGQILVFDPRHPEKQIQVVGRPAESETYLWMFTLGRDGKIYGCTFPSAKLVSYDPRDGSLADLGVMDETQKYSRSICTGPDGRIYLGIGFGRANVVAYDPATGERKAILPDEYRSHPEQTVATVYTGTDGHVYVQATRVLPAPAEGQPASTQPVTLRVTGNSVEETSNPAPAVSGTTLKDGRIVQNATLDGDYELLHPDGTVEKKHFDYQSDGSGLFMVCTGPLGRIYGSSWMPCQAFWYDPATGASENPGNPCEVGGEIYSMLDHHGTLYACAYPGSFLSKWDPAQPWNYGREPGSNPRGFGRLGPGHLRPRTMIHGPGERIYIGSYPEYGMHGGSLGVWDPATDTLVENHHPLIQDQSVAILVYDPKSGLIFGGSSTAGGGGTDPIAKEAKFFAFDPERKALVLEEAPVPGAPDIRSMTLVGRRIFGIAHEDDLFVYDIDKREYVHKGSLGIGAVLDCSLGLWKDGKLYGLTGKKVFRLDPETYTVTELAMYPGAIECGFAMDDRGIYFGDRARLMRYNWVK